MDSEEKLLTTAQAAKRLGVSSGTVRKWVDAGLLKAVRLPSGYRKFQPAAIEEMRRTMGMEPEEQP